jgi:hypothetical protein
MPRRTLTPKRVPAGVSRDVYARLLAAYRVKPGKHAQAARLAGCSTNTAQKAWEKGLKGPPGAEVPIREQLAARPPASTAGEPPAPAPIGTADLATRVERSQYEALEVADLGRTSCMLLNKGIVQIAPRLLALGERADEALVLLLKEPKDADPEKEAKRCLAMMAIGAKLGRTVSLITKSQQEADRALTESLRTPFAVAPKPDLPGAAGTDEDGLEEVGMSLDERECQLRSDLATVVRIRAREAREAGEDIDQPPTDGSAPPVHLDGSQQDTTAPSSPDAPSSPPPIDDVDATRFRLLDSLGPVVAGQVTEAAKVHSLTVDAVVRGVLGRDVGARVDAEAVTTAVCALDDEVLQAVMGLGSRWPA